jgi:hypothetical protein
VRKTPSIEESKLKLTSEQQADWLNFGASARAMILKNEEMQAIASSTDPRLSSLREKIDQLLIPSAHERDLFILARETISQDTPSEVDDSLMTFESDDENGVHVSKWCWLDFAGTPLSKSQMKGHVLLTANGYWAGDGAFADEPQAATIFTHDLHLDFLKKLSKINPDLVLCALPLSLDIDAQKLLVQPPSMKAMKDLARDETFLGEADEYRGLSQMQQVAVLWDIYRDQFEYFADHTAFNAAMPVLNLIFMQAQDNTDAYQPASLQHAASRHIQ